MKRPALPAIAKAQPFSQQRTNFASPAVPEQVVIFTSPTVPAPDRPEFELLPTACPLSSGGQETACPHLHSGQRSGARLETGPSASESSSLPALPKEAAARPDETPAHNLPTATGGQECGICATGRSGMEPYLWARFWTGARVRFFVWVEDWVLRGGCWPRLARARIVRLRCPPCRSGRLRRLLAVRACMVPGRDPAALKIGVMLAAGASPIETAPALSILAGCFCACARSAVLYSAWPAVSWGC